MTYDVIVLGTGGVGSAALYHLASQGLRVLGLDRFPIAHDRGSSHGQTRIIRQAYFEHPDYVPLLLRAYELWEQLSERCGEQLYHQTGLLQIGPTAGLVLPGVLASAAQHQLPIESLSPVDIRSRFPQFRVPDEWSAILEQRAGYLLVEQCVAAHCRQAVQLGAELRTGEAARHWQSDGHSVKVTTERATYHAGALVIAGGAWATELLPSIGSHLKVLRKSLFWYETASPRYGRDANCPAFLFEAPQGIYYGFPQVDWGGVKLAEHSGGEVVADPLNVDRGVDIAEQQRVESFASSHLEGLTRNCTRYSVCMYTMSPDEHFIIDRHPEFSNVVLAAGLSGHGFKFTSVLGEVLSEMVVGSSSFPIDFLKAARLNQFEAISTHQHALRSENVAKK